MKAWLSLTFAILAAAGAKADLFVSSFSDDRVLRYSDTGAFLKIFIETGSGGLDAPHRGIFGPDGHFYVASSGTHSILRYNGITGAFMDVFIRSGEKGLPSGSLRSPTDLTFGPDGLLYVASQGTNSILRFDAGGNFDKTFVSSVSSGGLVAPVGIRFYGDDFFVAGRLSGKVHRYDAVSGAFEATLGSGTFYGLDFDAGGSLYVADLGGAKVVKLNPGTGVADPSFMAAGSGGLASPFGIAFGPGNRLFVSGYENNSVKRFTTDGASAVYLGDFVAAGSGGLDEPTFITFAVPEPCAAALAASAIPFVIGRRRRRAHS